jgi:hypothetical protein
MAVEALNDEEWEAKKGKKSALEDGETGLDDDGVGAAERTTDHHEDSMDPLRGEASGQNALKDYSLSTAPYSQQSPYSKH